MATINFLHDYAVDKRHWDSDVPPIEDINQMRYIKPTAQQGFPTEIVSKHFDYFLEAIDVDEYERRGIDHFMCSAAIWRVVNFGLTTNQCSKVIERFKVKFINTGNKILFDHILCDELGGEFIDNELTKSLSEGYVYTSRFTGTYYKPHHYNMMVDNLEKVNDYLQLKCIIHLIKEGKFTEEQVAKMKPILYEKALLDDDLYGDLEITLFGYSLRLNFYDNRHWDSENNCWK